MNLQNEIDEWQKGQREWKDASPNAAPFFLIGNHEDRLRRYLWKNPELVDLNGLQLPNLLNFTSLGISWGGEDRHREIDLMGKLLITHGGIVRQHSAYTARAVVEREKYARSVMIGHTHRGGVHYASTRDGVVQGIECFCLCRTDPEYMLNPNWQQGLVVAEITKANLNIEPILFTRSGEGLKAAWRGKEYISN